MLEAQTSRERRNRVNGGLTPPSVTFNGFHFHHVQVFCEEPACSLGGDPRTLYHVHVHVKGAFKRFK
jgi:hypothetical protein